MGIHNLDKIFHPKSIAVIGASERTGSVGNVIMRNLNEYGFPGNVYPVNPNHRRLWNLPVCSSIKDLREPVDLAVITIPILSVSHVIAECVESGVGGAVIISAGGKETGDKGRRLEETIRNEAQKSGLRIIGPNCLGIVSGKAKLNASFANQMPIAGKMAFLSQSGAICTSVLDLSIQENIGFSYFVSLGSMLDVDFSDMIDYLGSRSDVSSIVMYIESLTRFRNFMSAARAVSRVKPIIALKAGRSASGAVAAASHTGAMAGEDSVYDTAFQRAGILRVKTFEELFDCAEMVSKQPKPRGSGLVVITNAGGPGVMAIDALAEYGYKPVVLHTDTIKKLDEILPDYWSKGNPIDMLGEATPELYQKVLEICLGANEVDGVLILSVSQALTDTAEVAEKLIDIIKKAYIPVITAWIGGVEMQKGRHIFNQAGVPTFDTPERAVRAFIDIYKFHKNIETSQEIPSRFPKELKFDHKKATDLIRNCLEKKKFIMTEQEAKELLCAYGIPVNSIRCAVNKEEACEKANALGFPVVLKINSRDITHKTDANGVRLDIKTTEGVCEAFESVINSAHAFNPEANIEGVTIQPMCKRPSYELLLGAKRDRDFGPVILFGMGGIFAEIIKDRAIALPPLNRLLARRLMERTNAYQLLMGYRNIAPANIELLEEVLMRIAQLVTDFSEIEELDINPFFVNEPSACAIDARVLLKPEDMPAPLHLVISSYPNQYEETIHLENVGRLFLRAIRPEDAPLLVELFKSLSEKSIYNRFFSPLKELPHDMIARFTQIDYDREIALVAILKSEEQEKMLGVGRVIIANDKRNAEFAVTVADQWHGKGIGAELLKRCLSISEARNIERIWGLVLADNTNMLALGRKIGFSMTRIPGSGTYELSFQFNDNNVKADADRLAS